ncbi:MAG TPA: acyl-CoA dehydrogenase family protein [Dehalococcoidia bacterium]|nr:acyl-CoA dehydrogenase family protein [Dehalococcoidia bacterium]
MNLDLTEEQEMLRTSARDFLTKECPKTLVRKLEEEEKGYSPELWSKMAELGWLGLVLPEEYNGMGMGFMDLIILLQEMGRNIVPGPFFSTVVLGSLPILSAGTEEQKKEFLPKIASGKMIFTIAITEPSARYDAAGIEAKATAQGDSFVINGTKLFVENAHIADYLICATRTKKSKKPEDGITLFLVDTKNPGIKCEVMPTIGADKLCEVVFEDVEVPKKNMLGQLHKGWPIVARAMEQAAIAKCAEMVGGCEASMDMTLAYVKERVQYGRPIGSFQVIQHYCANMWSNVETSRNILYMAAWKVAEGLPAAKDVAVAKGWINEAYKFVTERAMQCHGAIGTTRDHDIGLYYRRAKAGELAFGDTDFQKELVAQSLGL